MTAAFDFEGDDVFIGNYNGAYIEVMRGDGGDDEIAGLGSYDGATATEGIACGTGWGANDKPVSPIGGEVFTTKEGANFDHGGAVRLMNSKLVEGKVEVAKDVFVGFEAEDSAFIESELSFVHAMEGMADVGNGGAGEETEAAGVDAEDGDGGIVDEGYGVEHGAIATERDHEIGFAANFGSGGKNKSGFMFERFLA